VTGHEAPRLRAALDGKARVVENPAYESGLASSLQAGVAALDAEIDGAMILLGDMPDVTPGLIARLIEVFSAQGETARRKIVAPTREGRRGHPVLWGREFFPALLNETSGDSGARDVLERHADALIRVETDSATILDDLDTPDAYRERAARQA
jgi:molybdenum cofactor cytidylyltransferase